MKKSPQDYPVSMENMSKTCELYLPNASDDVLGFVGVPLKPGAGIYATPSSSLQTVRQNISTSSNLDDLFRKLSMQEVMDVYTAARVLEHGKESRLEAHFEELDVKPDQVRVFSGDLTVEGEIDNGGVLVVLGNVQTQHYCDYDDLPNLVCLGNLQCNSVLIGGAAAIAGDLQAKRLLYCFDHGSCVFVGGHAHTEVLLLDDKSLLCRDIRSRLAINMREFDVFNPDHWGELQAVLVDEVIPQLPNADDEDAWEALEDDDELFPLKIESAMTRIRSGQSLLAQESAAE